MTIESSPNLIDRLSATPYYQQLSDVLEKRIANREIQAGARLPSENDICIEFGLSRATVRQALQLLETRGYATRVNGRGVYATEPESSHGWMIQGGEGFLDHGHDLPLLEQVANPVAVDPDPNLRAEAEKRGWPVMTLRD